MLKNDKINPRLTTQTAPGVILPGARVDDKLVSYSGPMRDWEGEVCSWDGRR